MKYSKGIMWLDDCRIPFVDEGDIPNDMDKTHLENDRLWNGVKGLKPFLYQQNNKGRFTPNLLVCDDMLNDGTISKSNSGGISSGNNFGGLTQKYRDRKGVDDKGTNSRYYDLDKWFEKVITEL